MVGVGSVTDQVRIKVATVLTVEDRISCGPIACIAATSATNITTYTVDSQVAVVASEVLGIDVPTTRLHVKDVTSLEVVRTIALASPGSRIVVVMVTKASAS